MPACPWAVPHSYTPSRPRSTQSRRGDRVLNSYDLAFLKVMTARHRAGSKLAATEAREGSVPEVRELAQQLLAQQQAQIRKMAAWKRAWSKRTPSHLTARAPGHR
jgi:uncharacterized protein (DUF305 family)